MNEHNHSIQREQFNPNKGDRPSSPKNTEQDGDDFKQELNAYINLLTHTDGLDDSPEHTPSEIKPSKEGPSLSKKPPSDHSPINHDNSILREKSTPLQEANETAKTAQKSRIARLSDLLAKGDTGTIEKEGL